MGESQLPVVSPNVRAGSGLRLALAGHMHRYSAKKRRGRDTGIRRLHSCLWSLRMLPCPCIVVAFKDQLKAAPTLAP